MSTLARAARPALKFVRLSRAPILSQLQLDEALLRASALNWCVVNAAPADQRAVVLGCGGQVGRLVQAPACVADGIPLVRRFSGGGTVFIGAHTCFVSLIGNAGHLRAPPLPTHASDANASAAADADATAATAHASSVPLGVQCYPRPLMDWSGHLYDRVFRRANHASGAFHLRENDFCFGPRKFGGNAQSITRQRFCHHTSFLCDFDDAAMMRYLKLPEKAPSYRGGRSHLEFLCKLKDAFAHHHLPPHTSSVSNTPSALSGNHASAPPVDRAQYAADELCASLRRTLDEEFEVEGVDEADALAHLALPHQSGTRLLQPGVDFPIE